MTAAPVYGIYISQLIQFSRICSSYQDFLKRRVAANGKFTEPSVHVIISTVLRSSSWFGWMLYYIYVTDDNRYDPFVVVKIPSSHQIYNSSNTAWGTSAPWIGYPCRALELSPVFSLVVCHVLSIIFFLFLSLFCLSFFSLQLLITLSYFQTFFDMQLWR